MYEKAAHFLYSDTYGFIGEYLHISWQSRLAGRRSKAGDSIGGLPATGIAVYVADISPPQNPNVTRTQRRDTHKPQKGGRWEKQKLSLKEA